MGGEPLQSPRGLSVTDAEARLRTIGPNALPSSSRRGFPRLLFQTLAEPMILLMIACVSIYLAMGEIAEGIFLSLSLGLVLAISIIQQRRAERALDALRKMASPRALVIREGEQRRIPARDVVPDDLLVLQEGDRVPADARLISATHLFVDESLVTGESVSVRKRAGEGPTSEVLSGTMVVKGYGLALVTATGERSAIGRIGVAIRPEAEEQTPLQLETRTLVRIFASVGIAFCILMTVIYALTRGDWPHAILAGLSTAMSLLPEEFPVVLTIFMAMGAWRLSRVKILSRHMSAIENLGAITALCVDKTGTLTENKMIVRELAAGDNLFDLKGARERTLPERFHSLLEFGALASRVNPFDPMEKAIFEALTSELAGTEHIHEDWEFVEEYPLSDDLLAMSCAWRSERRGFVVAAKGAPDAIIDLCHLSGDEADRIRRRAEDLASKGLRVLGVARATFALPELPPRQHDFDFLFVGLLGLEDPLRPEAREAVSRCRAAGVRVMMMTGDSAGTALKIAAEAGMDSGSGVIVGFDLSHMSELVLQEKIKTVNVFARMTPEQKLRIINALKRNGELVAMTGDGVNDAPSLKWADIGIAMGLRGTDVAREAADLVLLDDRFSSIVSGIERGRLITANIRRAMRFIVSVHVPIAGLAMAAVVLRWPLFLFPAHIAFLELIIDPACTFLFESGEDEAVMKEPPRPALRKIFSWSDLIESLMTGGMVFAAILGASFAAHAWGLTSDEVRAVTFFSLVLSNLGLISLFFDRARSLSGRWSAIGMAAGVLSACAIVWIAPPLRALFGLPPFEKALLAPIGLTSGGALLAATLWRRGFHSLSRNPLQTRMVTHAQGCSDSDRSRVGG